MEEGDLGQKAWYGASIAFALEVHRASIEFGITAVKGTMLINGGAAIALLTFFEKNGLNQLDPNAPSFAWALLSFAIGVTAAAVGAGFGYAAQRSYTHELISIAAEDEEGSNSNMGDVFHWLTCITVGVALASFVFGLRQSYLAIF